MVFATSGRPGFLLGDGVFLVKGNLSLAATDWNLMVGGRPRFLLGGGVSGALICCSSPVFAVSSILKGTNHPQ